MCNPLCLRYLTDITSYGKKFCFSRYNICCIIDSFHDNLIFYSNMQDWSGNVIFNTCIRDDEHDIMTIEWTLENILEFTSISSSYFGIFVIYCMKEKTIRKSIYWLKFQRKFFVQTWLRWLLVSTIRLLTLKNYLEMRKLVAI